MRSCSTHDDMCFRSCLVASVCSARRASPGARPRPNYQNIVGTHGLLSSLSKHFQGPSETFQEVFHAMSKAFQARSRTCQDLPRVSRSFQNLPRPAKDLQGHAKTSRASKHLQAKQLHSFPETLQGFPKAFQRASRECPRVFKRMPIVFLRPPESYQRPPGALQGLPSVFQWLPRAPQYRPRASNGLATCCKSFQGPPRTPHPQPRAAGRLALPASNPRASHLGVATLQLSGRGNMCSCILGLEQWTSLVPTSGATASKSGDPVQAPGTLLRLSLCPQAAGRLPDRLAPADVASLGQLRLMQRAMQRAEQCLTHLVSVG